MPVAVRSWVDSLAASATLAASAARIEAMDGLDETRKFTADDGQAKSGASTEIASRSKGLGRRHPDKQAGVLRHAHHAGRGASMMQLGSTRPKSKRSRQFSIASAPRIAPLFRYIAGDGLAQGVARNKEDEPWN